VELSEQAVKRRRFGVPGYIINCVFGGGRMMIRRAMGW